MEEFRFLPLEFYPLNFLENLQKEYELLFSLSPEDFKKMLISKIPAGDLGTGEDVSNCVAFLASDMANYINGETIHVNGGMYMA